MQHGHQHPGSRNWRTRMKKCFGIAWLVGLAFTQLHAQAAPPVLRVTREMRIDGNAANLVTPGWILLLRDGRIAVSQTQDRSVLFFDSTGRSVGKFGRQGEGPGEFSTL